MTSRLSSPATRVIGAAPRPQPLPPAHYLDPQVHALEVERALRHAWHAVGRVDQMPDPGNVLRTEILGEPLIVVRGAGELRALSSPRASDEGARARLASLPATDRQGNAAVEVWNGFVMVNLDAGADALGPQIAPLTAQLAPYALADRVQVDLLEVGADWNWKLSMEHFSRVSSPARRGAGGSPAARAIEGVIELDTNDAWSLLYANDRGGAAVRRSGLFPASAGLPEAYVMRISALNVYPTLHLLADACTALWLQIGVQGPQRHTLRWRLLLPRATAELAGMGVRLDHYREILALVLEEDLAALRKFSQALAVRRRLPRRPPKQKSVQQLHRWLLQRVDASAP